LACPAQVPALALDQHALNPPRDVSVDLDEQLPRRTIA
jgi:hypothetical protein